MTFWQFLDKTLDRLPGWPDVRGWIMIALFMLTTQIVWMIYFRPNLAEIDLFKTIAQVLVVQALVGLALAFYFTATKTGSELAKQQGDITERLMRELSGTEINRIVPAEEELGTPQRPLTVDVKAHDETEIME